MNFVNHEEMNRSYNQTCLSNEISDVFTFLLETIFVNNTTMLKIVTTNNAVVPFIQKPHG